MMPWSSMRRGRRRAPRASFAHRVDLGFHILRGFIESEQDLVALAALIIAFGRHLAARLDDTEQLPGRRTDRSDPLRIGGIHQPLRELLQLIHDVVAIFVVIGARDTGCETYKRRRKRREGYGPVCDDAQAALRSAEPARTI